MRIWIDSDGGVDDALAIVMAAGIDQIEIAGCSAVYGNVPLERAAENIRLLLHAISVAVPVQRGARAALDGASVKADHVHGDDGLWGASQILEAAPQALEAGTRLTDFLSHAEDGTCVLGIGPATNIALAFRSGQLTGSEACPVILMTGAFEVPGNITPHAEFNTFSDPQALSDLLQRGARPVLIGLDVCTKVLLGPQDLSFFDGYPRSALAAALKQALSGYIDFYRRAAGVEGCFPHDAIALAAISHPQLFSFEEACVTVSEAPQTRGATRLTPGMPNAIVAKDVDVRAFRDLLFSSLDRALQDRNGL